MCKVNLALTVILLGLSACLAAEKPAGDISLLMKKGWPTDLPAEVPEWKNCEVVNRRGGASEYIIIVKADRKNRDAYLAALKDKGYAVGGNDKETSATKAGISIEISPRGEGQYQFWATFAQAGVWPDADKLPPFVQPLAGKPLVDMPELLIEDDYAEFTYTYKDITKDEAIAYFKSLAAKLTAGTYNDFGFSEGFASITEGKFSWNGKTWHFGGELAEDAPGSFRFAIGWQAE